MHACLAGFSSAMLISCPLTATQNLLSAAQAKMCMGPADTTSSHRMCRRASAPQAVLLVTGPLLQAAAQLIRHFPLFRDIVVSVARKTDAQMWPALFAAVGSPGGLLEAMLDVGALQSAACCLLIVDRIQGVQEAHGLALRLIQVCFVLKEPSSFISSMLYFLIESAELHACFYIVWLYTAD